MVVARQRPETANGIVFMLLEDERGTINLIVPPPVYERCRAVVRAAPSCARRGRLERREGATNVLVNRIEIASLERTEKTQLPPLTYGDASPHPLTAGRRPGPRPLLARAARAGRRRAARGRPRRPHVRAALEGGLEEGFGEGTGPVEAGARGKGRAVSATARAGCGRGRDGRGCGEGEGRRCAGSGTGRAEGVTGSSPNGVRSGRRRERHPFSRFLRRHEHVTTL